MVFPDLHKVFCTTRRALKVKIFKTESEVVSWEASDKPLTKHIVCIRKGRVANALDDSTVPWDCTSTGSYKTHTYKRHSIMISLINQDNFKLLGAKWILRAENLKRSEKVWLKFSKLFEIYYAWKGRYLVMRNGRQLWNVTLEQLLCTHCAALNSLVGLENTIQLLFITWMW